MVEPVGQEFYAKLVLDFEILPMCLGNVCGAISFEIMAIHEYGHRLPLPRSPGSVCPIGILGNRSILFRLSVLAFPKKPRPGELLLRRKPMSSRHWENHHVGVPFPERTAARAPLPLFQAQALNRWAEHSIPFSFASASISKRAEPIAEGGSMKPFGSSGRRHGTLQSRRLSELSWAETEFIAECPGEVGSQIKTCRFRYF